MKVGDLVRFMYSRWHNPIGIITHMWVGGSAIVLYEDGEHDVDTDDLEVVNASR